MLTQISKHNKRQSYSSTEISVFYSPPINIEDLKERIIDEACDLKQNRPFVTKHGVEVFDTGGRNGI